MTPFLTIFRGLPTTFRRFRRFSKNCSEGQTNVSEHSPNIFRRWPKMTEDDRRRPKKIRSCFDHTPANFSLVEARHSGLIVSALVSGSSGVRALGPVSRKLRKVFGPVKPFIDPLEKCICLKLLVGRELFLIFRILGFNQSCDQN